MSPVSAEDFIREVRRLAGVLAAHPRYFDVELSLADPVGEAEVKAHEAALGIELPALLRTLYSEVAGSLELAFDVHAEAWEGDGFAATGGGTLRIPPVTELARDSQGLVPLTGDGLGNGWCLDSGRADGTVIWREHDDPGHERDRVEPSFEAIAADVLGELLGLGRLSTDLETLLRTGTLASRPAPPSAISIPRPHPTAALERDAGRLVLLAELAEPSCHALLGLADARCVAASGRTVTFVDARTGTVLRCLDTGRPAASLAGHPEHPEVVVGHDSGLVFASADAPSTEAISAGNVTAVALDDRGEHLAVGLRSGVIELWSYASRARLRELARCNDAVVGLTWAGDALAATCADRSVCVLERDGTARFTTPPTPTDVGWPRVLIAGRTLIVVAGQLDVWRWSLEDGAHERTSADGLRVAGPLTAAVMGRDGDTLYTGRGGARVEAWSRSGAWRWSHHFADGSAVAGLVETADGLVVASTSGWLVRLATAGLDELARERLHLLEAWDEGGAAHAAKRLGISAADVEARLADFEDALGVPLLEPAKSRKQRGRPRPLNDRAIALLCQDG